MKNQIFMKAEEFRKKYSTETKIQKKLDKVYGKKAPTGIPEFESEPFESEMLIQGQGVNLDILQEISYALVGEFHHTIYISPRPTPRPRAGRTFKGAPIVYNDPKYSTYKELLIKIFGMMGMERPEKPYSRIYLECGLPYPKSTPKYKQIDKEFHLSKPDWDNFIKGCQDALEQAGIIHADGGIAAGLVLKRYTLKETGYIKFSLY